MSAVGVRPTSVAGVSGNAANQQQRRVRQPTATATSIGNANANSTNRPSSAVVRRPFSVATVATTNGPIEDSASLTARAHRTLAWARGERERQSSSNALSQRLSKLEHDLASTKRR
jgi:hypothetical protein